MTSQTLKNKATGDSQAKRKRALTPCLIRGVFALLLTLPALLQAAPAGIAEPATTFYGKVIGTADLQPFLITEGRLKWTIRRADGADVTLHAKLYAFNKGAFSYRLDVPHAALSLGLESGAENIPLALYEQTHRHQSVLLDGEPVTLLGPAGEVFTSAQILRSSTYRLDLGVNRSALDTSGDGIPDWWCDLYGLDKQGNIAGTVLPGGLTIGQCYALGLNPNADHTIPVLLTEETIVYANGSTALILQAFDLDTEPSNLVYTVTSVPFGTIARLAADGTLEPLEPGATFTQADALSARVVYQHTAEVSDPGLFGLALSDGDHAPVDSTVRLLLYESAINEISPRSDLYQLASAGFIVGEGAFIDASGAAVSYALAGSTLTGGAADDVLTDAPASGDDPDCVWTGGAGADRFVITDFSAHTVTLTDFSVAEGDMLDITAFNASGKLSDHVSLAGNQLTFASGLTVTLNGLSGEDLYTLVTCGAILTDLPLTPRVSVVATTPVALRNGPVPGVFTLIREGDAATALTLNIQVSGSANNGVDYMAIPSTSVTIPAGVSALEIVVTPYTTGANSAVVAALAVLAGSGYTVGPAPSASITIEPRKTEVGVEAILPVAAKASGEFGLFLLWRDAAGSSLLVQNTLGGEAVSGTDYQTRNFDTGAALNPAAVNFLANETEKLIEVALLPAANLAEAKRVTLSLTPTTRYAIMPGFAAAEVVLIDQWETYEGWLTAGLPPMLGPLTTDASTLFKRYAYGANPLGSDLSGFPRPFMLSDGMTVRVKQPVARIGVSYTLSGFTDLADRSGSAVGFTEVPPPKGQPTGPDWKYYRLNSNGDRGFISVEVK